MKKNNKPTISLIAVVAKDRGIGKDNKLLFDIPEDLKHFRKITMGHTVIMGYNTYKSLGNKALPKRRNIVLCFDDLTLIDAEVFKSIDEALDTVKNEEEVFFIGGASIYHEAIKIADKLYLTEVEGTKEADTYFPIYTSFHKKKKLGDGVYNKIKYSFYEYEK